MTYGTCVVCGGAVDINADGLADAHEVETLLGAWLDCAGSGLRVVSDD